MAAAAPRLSDYEEFKDYEGQKLDFDKEIIGVQRVIAQLIQKKDTPEHITDEFKTLCLRSSTKNTMYHRAVNNYYESIINTDNKASFVSLGTNINLFLKNINRDIEAAKDSIIAANKATKDELEGYKEYKRCIGIHRALVDLLKKIQGRIGEIDNKEKAAKAAEAAAAAAQRRAAANAQAAALNAKAEKEEWLKKGGWASSENTLLDTIAKNVPYVVSRSGQTDEKDEFTFDLEGIRLPGNPLFTIVDFVTNSVNRQIAGPLQAPLNGVSSPGNNNTALNYFPDGRYRYIVKKYVSVGEKLFYLIIISIENIIYTAGNKNLTVSIQIRHKNISDYDEFQDFLVEALQCTEKFIKALHDPRGEKEQRSEEQLAKLTSQSPRASPAVKMLNIDKMMKNAQQNISEYERIKGDPVELHKYIDKILAKNSTKATTAENIQKFLNEQGDKSPQVPAGNIVSLTPDGYDTSILYQMLEILTSDVIDIDDKIHGGNWQAFIDSLLGTPTEGRYKRVFEHAYNPNFPPMPAVVPQAVRQGLISGLFGKAAPAAAAPAPKGDVSKTDFLTLKRLNNIIATHYSLATTCKEDITDKGSDLLKQFDVLGKVRPSNDFTVIKASAGGINNQQALRNDCLIQAFLTSTSPAFRCLSQDDKDEFGNYFRRRVFLELLQNTQTYIAQPEIEDPVHPNGSKEKTRREVSSTTPLSDRQLRMLCEIYRVGVMVFTLSKDPQNPGVRAKEIILMNPGALAVTEYYVIYNPDNIHYDSVRVKDKNTYTVTAAEAENYRTNISVVGKSVATNTCKYNSDDVVKGLEDWVIISRKISDDKQYQHLAQQPCSHYVLMKHLDAAQESKNLDILGSIAYKALENGVAELSTSISPEGTKANTFSAASISTLSAKEIKALAELPGPIQYLIFEAKVLENPRPLNILGALAVAAPAVAPVPPPPLRLAPVSTRAAPSVNAATTAAQLAAAERLKAIRGKFSLPAPAAVPAVNITAQANAAAKRLERLKAALTAKASKGGRSRKQRARKTRRRHAQTKERRA